MDVQMSGAVRSDENGRRSGSQTAASPRQPRAGDFHAAGSTAVKFLCTCLALAGVAYVVFAPADVATTASPVSTAAAAPSRASFDYFPANYVNQGRDGDGNVMTYEHD